MDFLIIFWLWRKIRRLEQKEQEGIYPSLARSDAGAGAIEAFELSDGYSDSRYYHPSAVNSVLGKPISRRVLVTPQGHRSTSGQSVVPRGRRFEFLGFAAPDHVLICVRRNRRRQVLFAKGKTGAGNRRPRWNATSYIWC